MSTNAVRNIVKATVSSVVFTIETLTINPHCFYKIKLAYLDRSFYIFEEVSSSLGFRPFIRKTRYKLLGFNDEKVSIYTVDYNSSIKLLIRELESKSITEYLEYLESVEGFKAKLKSRL